MSDRPDQPNSDGRDAKAKAAAAAEARALMERAGDLLHDDLYEEALPLVRRATELAPWSFEAWCELGSTCGYAGEVEELETAFERALQLAVTPFEELLVWMRRGHAENNALAYEEALESIARLMELDPEWATPWLMRGMVLGNMGVFRDRHYHEEALIAFDRALEIGGLSLVDERVVYSLRAKSLYGLGREEEAAVFERKAAEMWQAEQAKRARRGKPDARREVH